MWGGVTNTLINCCISTSQEYLSLHLLKCFQSEVDRFSFFSSVDMEFVTEKIFSLKVVFFNLVPDMGKRTDAWTLSAEIC